MRKAMYPAIIAVVLLIFFALLEMKYPYYFCHDDNRGQNLPLSVQALRSLLNGDIASINYYQFLGQPLLANGQSQALYPLIYISSLLSKLFLGHYFALIDIEVIIHFIFGSIGFWYVCKFFGLNDESSVFAALTWPLSSFFMYISNSWVHVSGIAAYFPWMIYLSCRLLKELKYRHLITLAVIRTLFFFIGHPQFFLYSYIFEFLFFIAMLSITYIQKRNLKKAVKRIILYIGSSAATLLFSLPLLLPMWNQIQSSGSRSAKMTWGVFISGGVIHKDWLNGLKSPNLSYHVSTGVDMSYIGIIPLLFVVIAVLLTMVTFITKNQKAKNYIPYVFCFLLLAGIAYLWATNILSPLLFKIPIINRFRWHFKLVPYMNFFLILISSIGLYLSISQLQMHEGMKKAITLALVTISFLHMANMYLTHPIKSIRVQLEKMPLQEDFENRLKDARVLSVGFNWHDSATGKSLGYNYATLWELIHLAGYDPIIPKKNQDKALGLNLHAYYNELNGNKKEISDLNHLRTWGVKWYVVNNNYVSKYGDLPFEKKFIDGQRTVYYDGEATPMVYLENNKTKGILFKIKGNKIMFNTSTPQDTNIVVNFLYHPYFKAKAGNEKVAVSSTKEGQILIRIPKGTHNVVLNYTDIDLTKGLLFTSLITALGIGFLFTLWCKQKKVSPTL